MGSALLVSRVLLACVFVVAGAAKLADLPGSRRAVVDFGVPVRVAGVVGVGLPVGELVVAVALLLSGSARYGALGALALLGVFIAGILVVLARGAEADCHCFGQLHSARVGWRTLVRNLLLAAVAGFVAVGGWGDAGVSATRWVTRVPAAWLVAIGAGVVMVALVGFVGWFCLQLLAQNGRTLGRLEALETAIAQLTLSAGPELGHDPGALGAGLSGAGLAVDSVAPGFELDGPHGERVSLASLLAGGRRVMLVFSDAGCGPCTALLPAIAAWQRAHQDVLEIAVIASGDREQNHAKAAEHHLEGLLLQDEREVADAYEAHGTPTAVIIDPDGLIASPTVGGAEAITTLLAQATRPLLAVREHVPTANGNGTPPPRDSSRVGEPAPQLTLSDLNGHRVALSDLYTQRTLAIFWNPGCGFCQQMLDDLKAFEDHPPAHTPRLLVISSGDPEQTRQQRIGSQVLIDPDGQAMNAFDAHGTPMGVLIDHGQIASPIAAGADAVLQLAHTAASQPSRQNGRPS